MPIHKLIEVPLKPFNAMIKTCSVSSVGLGGNERLDFTTICCDMWKL